jgi:hypothetical protein
MMNTKILHTPEAGPDRPVAQRSPGARRDEPLTAVESWLMDLGLRAIEVPRCPAAECAVCASSSERRADAA